MQNVQKIKRNLGQSYVAVHSKKLVPARSIKPPCGQNCRLKCTDRINDARRLDIFNTFWALGDRQLQRMYILSNSTKITPKYKYTNAENPRNPNHAFYFSVDDEKIRPAKKIKIFSLMNEKHRDEIYETLQDMMSSEEDDDEDLGEELNDRLDYIQNIVTDHDLYEILSAPVDDQISAVNLGLPLGSPPIDVPIPAPGVQLPASSSPIDEPMPDPDVYLPANSPPIDEPMPDPDVHLPSCSPPVVVPISNPDIHLPPSSTNQSRNQPSRSMSTRPSYVEVQNRNWQWTNDIEDFDSAIFDRPMTVRKRYSNRSQPKDYFMDMCSEEAMDLIVDNTNIYAQTNHSKNWIDITKVELFAYFGITILMSVNPLSDYQLYWSTDPFYNNQEIYYETF